MTYKVGERLSWYTTTGVKLTGLVCYIPNQANHEAICRVDEACVKAKSWGDWGWPSTRHPEYGLPDQGIYWSLFRGAYAPVAHIGAASYKQIFMQKLKE